MEHNSSAVSEGKLISATTYANRPARYTEVDLGIAKIDYYDPVNKVVHEVKKSNRMEHAHEWQVKYYLYLLDRAGVTGAVGIIEYPRLRQKRSVHLVPEDVKTLETALVDLTAVITSNEIPCLLAKHGVCRACSYYDFCLSD